MNNNRMISRRVAVGAAVASLAAMGLMTVLALPCRAQEPADPTAAPAHFDVELRDASLSDALEMIFKAANNQPHVIDEKARGVKIAFATWTDKPWDDMVRTLCNLYSFKFSKDPDSGTYLIEPREPVAPPAGAIVPVTPGFGAPATGMPAPGPTNANPFNNPFAPAATVPNPFGGAPAAATPGATNNPFAPAPNPFGAAPGAPTGGIRPPAAGDQKAPKARPTMRGNAQTFPIESPPGTVTAGGIPPVTAAPSKKKKKNAQGEEEEDKSYHLLMVKHIYAGGITQVFSGGGAISTEQLVVPEGAGEGGGGGSFGGGGGSRNGSGNGSRFNSQRNGGRFGSTFGGSRGGNSGFRAFGANSFLPGSDGDVYGFGF